MELDARRGKSALIRMVRAAIACHLRPRRRRAYARHMRKTPFPRRRLSLEEYLAMEEASLSFTDEALRAIAKKAQARETGARGLRSIIEQVMLDIMFELPDQPRGNRYVVNEEVVDGRQLAVSLRQIFDAESETERRLADSIEIIPDIDIYSFNHNQS